MDEIKERYGLASDRIREIAGESGNRFIDAFRNIAEHYVKIFKLADLLAKPEKIFKTDEKKIRALYDDLYRNIMPENYDTAYENPSYAVKKLGQKTGKLIGLLATDAYSATGYAAVSDYERMTLQMELFIEIYCIYAEKLSEIKDEKLAEDTAFRISKAEIKAYMQDNTCYMTKKRFENYLPVDGILGRVIDADHKDLRYLYLYGEYITENEIKTATYMNSMKEAEVKKMADTLTDGYIRGFKTMNSILKEDGTVLIAYPIGFERMIRFVVKRLEKMGMKVTTRISPLRSRTGRSLGVMPLNLNSQFIYDHRNDYAFYFDKKSVALDKEATTAFCEEHKELLRKFNGPMLVESFGEPDFNPVNKKEVLKLTKAQKTAELVMHRDMGMIMNKYMPDEESSFAIIAYPVPSIGKDFEKIFAETVKINTLDNDEYTCIQQLIIDELDKGYACRVKGCNGNKTDIKVMLWKLKDPKKETIFENCTADVNIPVGEVFTSPVLKGTNGTLHVTSVFLNGLEYKDLKLEFKDGCIAGYTCGNFKTEAENKEFLKERLLHEHEFLPLGEFAIGTNTIAYVMGRKYGIQGKLPILIAEKTGPHFAVGDTCYSYSEDKKVYNPDGKEIVARENEYSALRDSKPEKAYFNCHTDITIPYNELGEITSLRSDGTEFTIMKNGKFVVPGTEKLNEALKGLE